MIAHVSRGADLRGTLRYLFGPGGTDPHRDPHLVAGFRPPGWLEPPARQGGGRDLGELAELLAQPIAALRHPGRSPLVWRCSVRTAPADRYLSDTEWAEIAAEVLDRADVLARGRDGIRWVAVRHAVDHIHLVAVLADTGGRRRAPKHDLYGARRACRIIEDRYDLRRTAECDRTPAPAPGRAEIEAARHRGSVWPARYILHEAVHAATVAAADERDFFDRLAAVGIAIHRRRERSGETRGYAVALPGHVHPDGTPYYFGGGKLAPDLTLPKLRHRWSHRTPAAGAPDTVWRTAADQIVAAATELGHRTPPLPTAEAPEGAPGPECDIAWAAADLLRGLAYCFPDERLLRRAVYLYDQAAREPGGRLPPPTPTGDRLRGLARDLMRSAEESDPARRDTRAIFEALPGLIAAAAGLREAQGRASQAGTAARAATHTSQCAGHVPIPSPTRSISLAPILNPKPERRDRAAGAAGDVRVFSAARAAENARSSERIQDHPRTRSRPSA